MIKLLAFILIMNSSFAIEPTAKIKRGEATFSWLWWDVYKAQLWCTHLDQPYLGKLSLELTYLMDLKGEDIADRSVEEILKQNKSVNKSMLENIFKGIFPNVKKGDRILANFTPDRGLELIFNRSKVLGKISDVSVAKMFLDIWLSKKSSRPEFREKLLVMVKS